MKLHHIGLIVKDIDDYQSKMIFENKVSDLIDPIQNARLSLYTNFGEVFIELIQPLNQNSFTWNSLIKNGNHVHHFCYEFNEEEKLDSIEKKFNLIKILGPLPAKLFNDRKVVFYFTRNKKVVEFLLTY